MSNRLRIAVPLVRVLCAVMMALLGLTGTVLAADAQAPTVTRALAKPLKAAQDALQAKNYDETIAHVISPTTIPFL